MKYIEFIKSIVLLFLVLLSVTLTFLIWTYKPSVQIIEETLVEQLMVGKQKNYHDVIKPYRILARDNDEWTGSIGSSTINELMEQMISWKGSELVFLQNNMSEQEINEFLRKDHRITLFFSEEVPLKVFYSILPLSQDELPEMSFDRLVIDWSNVNTNNFVTVYFLNTQAHTLYSTQVRMSEHYFNTSLFKTMESLRNYKEIERSNRLSLYVPTEQLELTQYTYYIDEIHPDTFRDILFYNRKIVRKNVDSQDSFKYTDGMTRMTVDLKHRNLNYVNPASESIIEVSASHLLMDSFDFINEHGGFTGDYRLVSMNVPKHVTEYQLYKHGFPVISADTSTRISTTWGENQLFRYKRPYYLLDMDITSEKFDRKVATGMEVVEFIQKTNQLQLEELDDIILGYYLKQNENNLLFTLEPSWFAISQGSWIRITPEVLGGGNNGLE